MPQDNFSEQEKREEGIKNNELRDETNETTTPNSPEQSRTTDEIKRPEIPDSQKPKIPQGENIPTGGPGDQNKTPPASQLQTQDEKIKKIKAKMAKPIHLNTPKERSDSSEIEDEHNRDVLGQN